MPACGETFEIEGTGSRRVLERSKVVGSRGSWNRKVSLEVCTMAKLLALASACWLVLIVSGLCRV